MKQAAFPPESRGSGGTALRVARLSLLPERARASGHILVRMAPRGSELTTDDPLTHLSQQKIAVQDAARGLMLEHSFRIARPPPSAYSR